MAQQVHDPGHGNADQRQDAKTQKLHQFVGDDGAGIAQVILGDLVDRMVERWIVDRPGGKGHAYGDQRGQKCRPRKIQRGDGV